MDLTIPQQRWTDLRRCLGETADRFATLVAGVARPKAAAIGHWSVADTAAHVAITALLNARMLTGHHDHPPFPVPGLERRLDEVTFDDIARLNDHVLDKFPQREPGAVAEWVRDAVTTLIERSAGLPPTALVSWLGGARLPVVAVLAHQLNELLIHGHDIARTSGADWPIAPHEATYAYELFLLRLLGGDSGRLFAPVAHRCTSRIAVEFRSPHTIPVMIVSQDGRLSVDGLGTDPGDDIDVRVRFDPAALMLTIFRRRNPVLAALTGKIIVTGRRPWLLRQFLDRAPAP
jgi:uncharacterized protein (TIGR03083 family)